MIHHKLKGLPPIYYFNLDHRTDRREYLEKQFLDYGITNYCRVNSSRYSVENYEEWNPKSLLTNLEHEYGFLLL